MDEIRYFVLLYDRSAGQIVKLKDYSADKRETAATFAKWLESAIRDKYAGNAEVLLLAASSLDAIKRTHARYFTSARDLSDASRFRLQAAT